MFRKRSFNWVLAVFIVTIFVFSACSRRAGSGTPDDYVVETPKPTPAPEPEIYIEIEETKKAIDALAGLRELEAQFPMVGRTASSAEIIPGGTFYWGRAQSGGFPGIFHPHLQSDAADQAVTALLSYNLISINDAMEMTQDGIATWEKDLDELSFTMTWRPGLTVYWSDGVEMTLADLYYAFWFISHPDYEGTMFGEENSTSLVVGAQAFRAGDSNYIEGLVLSDDERQLKIYFTKMSPSMLYSGAILNQPLPRHHFEGIPVGESRSHMNSRDNFIGFGPFIIDTVVPSESVLLRANPNYWQGAPYLDYIYYHIIPPDMQAEFMMAGRYDRLGMRHIDVAGYSHATNVQMLSRVAPSQSFIYFTLGARRRDPDTNEIYFVPRYDNHPITDPRMRHAIAYALDFNEVNMTIRSGLHSNATTVLHPFNANRWIDPYSQGFGIHNPDRANQILDEAGYEWGPEGFRLDTEGNPFYVNLGWRINPGIDEVTFAHYQANLREIGIDLRLWDDDWIDHNFLVRRNITSISSFELSPNDDMHMWQMSLYMNPDPNPAAMWGHNRMFNLANFTNPTFQQILADIASTKAWDGDFRADAYRRWAIAFDYYLPAIYETWSVEFDVINNRVANWTLDRSTFTPESFSWHRVGFTSYERYVHE
ncbi:MAG: ABC transporter substrate-binding protein [Defluviitaleaceae bacterium]|nr:ABC transporter substrate-binding protein [Defluviitaleaceae bacterium]